MIVVIDYQMGNVGAILNMFKKIGAGAIASSNTTDIERADKLILPGVGAFDAGINNIQRLGLIEVLNRKVIKDRAPILGICLGLQLFTQKSEEGRLPGLGWLEAETIKFKAPLREKLKIPHMGWNTVLIKKDSPLFRNFDGEARFYFVHSYHLACHHPEDILTITNYGREFISSVERDNIIGVQFHPEKSHKFGMRLLKNFITYY